MEHRVLFVDDEVGTLEALQHLVLDESWEVLTASSGCEALSFLEHAPVSLILSDYRMPEMTGVELLQTVHQRSPKTVRMIMSGYAQAHVVVEAINEGHVENFIAKPWNDEHLLEALHEGLRKCELETENERLQEALRDRNASLREANMFLDRKVRERTASLRAQNRALRFAQEVLDQLPYALYGIDRNMRLMITNERARHFRHSESDRPVLETLPREAVALLEEVLQTGTITSRSIREENGTIHADCVPLGESASRGVILILRDDR